MNLDELRTDIDYENSYYYQYVGMYVDNRLLRYPMLSEERVASVLDLISAVDRDPILKIAKVEFDKLDIAYKCWADWSAEAIDLMTKLVEIDKDVKDFYNAETTIYEMTYKVDDAKYIKNPHRVNKWQELLNRIISEQATTNEEKECKQLATRLNGVLTLIDVNILKDGLKNYATPIIEKLNEYAPIHAKTLMEKKPVRELAFSDYKDKIFKAVARQLGKPLDDEYENVIVLASIYNPQDGDFDGMIHREGDGTLDVNSDSHNYVKKMFSPTFAKYAELWDEFNRAVPSVSLVNLNCGIVIRDKEAVCMLAFDVYCHNKTITETELEKLEEILGKI